MYNTEITGPCTIKISETSVSDGVSPVSVPRTKFSAQTCSNRFTDGCQQWLWFIRIPVCDVISGVVSACRCFVVDGCVFIF